MQSTPYNCSNRSWIWAFGIARIYCLFLLLFTRLSTTSIFLSFLISQLSKWLLTTAAIAIQHPLVFVKSQQQNRQSNILDPLQVPEEVGLTQWSLYLNSIPALRKRWWGSEIYMTQPINCQVVPISQISKSPTVEEQPQIFTMKLLDDDDLTCMSPFTRMKTSSKYSLLFMPLLPCPYIGLSLFMYQDHNVTTSAPKCTLRWSNQMHTLLSFHFSSQL